MTAAQKKKPKRGSLLLSEPFLQDPNFQRTVVLLTDHNEDGTIGFILNRPMTYKIHEIVEDFPFFDALVHVGGPVQRDSLHYIHRVEALAEDGDEIAPGVYWGGNFELLKHLIKQGTVRPDDIRFFVGYSGWAAQQLEDEISSKSWIVSQGSDQYTFAPSPTILWSQILEHMGGKYRAMAHYPTDPSLN